MQQENLYEPFSISFETLDECPKSGHKHTFFELVYILEGSGTQCINKSTFRYRADHMFLITPQDCHSFAIEQTTRFFFLRFNDIYIDKKLQTDNIERLEFILQNANHEPGCILKNQPDKRLIRPTIEAIFREYETKDIYNGEIIQQLVNTIIIIVARNIARNLPEKVNEQTDEKAIDILQYIQSNIFYPERIKAQSISKYFGISTSYLGRYFKKHTQETMQQYITNYKIQLIENRLKYSNKRINEIAFEFEFTDESHLNRFFKNHKGVGPNEYRKAVRVP
jgi:AraC-like DNA-binding protein